MTKKLELYRCEICGNIVQIMHEGMDALVCCGEPMNKIDSHGIEEEMKEKHVPAFLNEQEIQIGSEPHPMTPEHHIEFIQAMSEDKKHVYTKFLEITDEPKMKINNQYKKAREYCNIHGLWQN